MRIVLCLLILASSLAAQQPARKDTQSERKVTLNNLAADYSLLKHECPTYSAKCKNKFESWEMGARAYLRMQGTQQEQAGFDAAVTLDAKADYLKALAKQ